MNILVLHGGTSDERAVSLRSGQATATALVAKGHTVTLHDHDGKALDSTFVTAFDVVFPVLHGIYGEDGTLQSELEMHNVPFVGSNSTASKLCFDKNVYRTFLQKHSVPVAPGKIVSHKSYSQDPMIVKPHVIKPINGGSSLDTFIIHDPLNPPEDLTDAFKKHQDLLLEKLVLGKEITVGVLGNQALPVVEIIPPVGGTFDYANKYNGATDELCPPVNVSVNQQREAQQLAKQIHQLTQCSNYSRTDMIITPAGEIVVLETNTAPGMTDQSLFPKAARSHGLSMEELCDQLVNLALSE